MATCNARYTFTSASIGSYGGQNDGRNIKGFATFQYCLMLILFQGVFQQSPFDQVVLGNRVPIPLKPPLWNESTTDFQNFFVGDAAPALKKT